MASYHLSVKTISRSQGRSATAAAAYRAGEVIACERYGVEHDYTRKGGVEHTEIIAPDDAPDWSRDREQLWNAVEASETRKNSMVAREWEVALPHELNADQRRELVAGFTRDLVERYGIAADVAIHAPHREGDQRNYHAHILTTTRTVTPEGLDAKTRELHGQSGSEEIKSMRGHWADLSNDALERAGQSERIDHRSLGAQREEAERNVEDASQRGDDQEAERQRQRAEAFDRLPEPKLGVAATGLERRAQGQAEREGRDYTPVTERGAAVAQSREDRSMLDEARERMEAARGAYSDAREEGQGRASAFSEVFKVLLERSKPREPEPERGETSERLAELRGRSAVKPEPEAAYPEPSKEASETLRAMKERQDNDKLRELIVQAEGSEPQGEAPGRTVGVASTDEAKSEDDDRGELDRAEAERERQEEEQRAAQAREEAEQEAARLEQEAAKSPGRQFMDKIKARDEKIAQERERDDYDPWDR